ncbi:MAG: hypothetical protein EKK64_06230, partial [Neisseriaceae bacterium]
MSHEFEDSEDFVLDDLFKNKKKKVDGKKKGNRTELDLTKVLNARFKSGFSRSVGSGNRWSQTVLPKHAQDIFSGDLVVPQGFKFVIESKGGYDDVDLSNIFLKGNNVIDSFLKQVTSDSKRCDRKPLLCWKKTRKPWLAFILTKDLPEEDNFQYTLRYRNWTAVA